MNAETHVQDSAGASVYGGGSSISEEGGRGAEGALILLEPRACPSNGCFSIEEAMRTVSNDHW